MNKEDQKKRLKKDDYMVFWAIFFAPIMFILIFIMSALLLGLLYPLYAQETIEQKRERCFKDCAKFSPDIEKMKGCYLEEVNCIVPEKDPAFNELEKEK